MSRCAIACVLTLYTILSLLLGTGGAGAQGSGRNLDPAAMADAIDRYVASEMRAARIPGMALGIIYDGRVAYVRGYGVADGTGRPVTPQTPFALGSVSKSFTALAIMQLVEEGKIDLDAPARTYLPALRLADPAVSERVTVRHLLNQVSGISTYAGEDAFAADPRATAADLIAGMATLAPRGRVGETYQYSNLNYIVLGAIVEAASGQTYGEYVRERIYAPLGMTHSHVTYADAQADGMADGHQSFFGFPLVKQEPFRAASVATGHLVSSAEDMSRYLLMWLNGGTLDGATLISPEGVRALQTPASRVTSYVSYAMGWYTNPDASVVWHGGSTYAFHSSIKLLRGPDLGVVALYNLSDDMVHSVLGEGWMIPDGVMSILYGEAPPRTGFVGTGRVYWLLDAAALLAVIGLAVAVVRLPRWREAWRWSRRRWTMVAGLVALHALLPAAILLGVQARASWRVVLAGVPDFGMLLLFVAAALVVIGVAKAAMAAGATGTQMNADER